MSWLVGSCFFGVVVVVLVGVGVGVSLPGADGSVEISEASPAEFSWMSWREAAVGSVCGGCCCCCCLSVGEIC